MRTPERDPRGRRRLLALLLLLLLAAVAALVLIGRGDTHGPGSSTEVTEQPPRSSSAGSTEPESQTGSAPSSRSAGEPTREPTRKPTPTSPGPVGAPTTGMSPGGSTGDDEASSPQVDARPGVPFAIAGGVRELLVGVWTSVPTAITNPNDAPITITSLRVAVWGSPNGCDAVANFETRPSSAPFTVPAHASDYPVPAARRPWILLRSLAANQNRCKRQTIALSFSGSAAGS